MLCSKTVVCHTCSRQHHTPSCLLCSCCYQIVLAFILSTEQIMVDKWQSVNPTGWATASHKPHTLAKLGADSDGSNQSPFSLVSHHCSTSTSTSCSDCISDEGQQRVQCFTIYCVYLQSYIKAAAAAADVTINWKLVSQIQTS